MASIARRTLISLNLLASRSLSTKAQASPAVQEDTSRDVLLRYLAGKDNGIAVLGLNRVEARNAFSKRLIGQLSEALDRISQDKNIRVLVLRSLVPRVFCAGADLRERIKMEPQEVGNFVTSLRNLMSDIESISAPVISAIDGVRIYLLSCRLLL